MSATEIEQGSSTVHDSAAVGGCKMTPRERILLLPEHYIGSVDKCTRNIWVADADPLRRRVVTYVPGLYKIFDDVLVYAAENKHHDQSMDSLVVDIDVAECRISVYYTGQGVPTDELHPGEGVYTPEMVFADLSDHQEIAGGRNSYGVKLANVFSTEFAIEIVDSRLQRNYKQIFSENMGKKSKPEITFNSLGVNSTRIIFKPDLAKFHMTHLDDDVIALMKKRVVDMVGFLDMTVQVEFNGQKVQRLQSFSNYTYAYLRTASKGRSVRSSIYQRFNDHLEVCVNQSEGTFEQVSFANKFATTEGGTHVDCVSNQIVARLVKMCSKVLQVGESDVEESEIKRHLWVFVNAIIDNPTSNSPTRDALTTPQERFGSSCELTDGFLLSVFDCIAGQLSPSSVLSQARKASKRSADRYEPSQARKASKKNARRYKPSV